VEAVLSCALTVHDLGSVDARETKTSHLKIAFLQRNHSRLCIRVVVQRIVRERRLRADMLA
jgi:hypothetical protein